MDKANLISVRADIFENSDERYGVIFYDKSGYAVERFEDVFIHREQAERFAGKCNSNALTREHIYDVLEDFLE